MMRDAMRQTLIDLDVPRARAIWAAAAIPQPATDDEALTSLHMARTQTQTIVPRLRYYSHRWLIDRGLPSGLPDRLKPLAERMYPRKVHAAAVATSGFAGTEACAAIERAMTDAWQECFADGDTDKAIVRPHMMRARFRERRRLMLPMKWEIPTEWRPRA